MKKTNRNDKMTYVIYAALIFFQLLFLKVLTFAQDIPNPDVDIDVTEKTTSPYGAWWMWAIGVAVFIIIIVAITSRGRRRD